MSLNLRIFFAYFAILGGASYLLLNVFMSELKPGVRQSTEDTLVDMSNLLAEVVREDLIHQRLSDSAFSESIERFLARSYRAKIFSIDKLSSAIRIYITDQQGIVQYDSAGMAKGEDYSRWNDVYLTLKGRYGARSTAMSPGDDRTTVMHVAAPIVDQGQIIGVLTVAKANMSLQPFINMAQEKIKTRGIWLVLFSLMAGVILSYGLTVSIRKLARYSDRIANGEWVAVPKMRETELAKLAKSINNMREQLAGKDYVEKYVYSLTHELKSPVAAIKGAAEILTPAMPAADQQRFIANIQHESQRIDEMINRLLALTQVEKQDRLTHLEPVELGAVVTEVLQSKALQIEEKKLRISAAEGVAYTIDGDRFLLLQAVDNLLQNAIDFSLPSGCITIRLKQEQQQVILSIHNSGEPIPHYALTKLFDRFYSLPRPDTQKKSSGLGLCFVKQISALHDGSVRLFNTEVSPTGAGEAGAKAATYPDTAGVTAELVLRNRDNKSS